MIWAFIYVPRRIWHCRYVVYLWEVPAPRQLQLLHPRGLRARTDGLHYRPWIKVERNDTEMTQKFKVELPPCANIGRPSAYWS